MFYLFWGLILSFNLNAQISETKYHQILDNIETIYKPKYQNLGKEFLIKRSWENLKINAKARVNDDLWWIDMYGGYPRHNLATVDGFTAFTCHEIGHHFGGFPYWEEPNIFWASAEGQADYFVTMKCLRILWDQEDNKTALAKRIIPKEVTSKCGEVYLDEKKFWLCVRSSLAGFEMLKPIAYQVDKLNFATPNTWQTSFTFVSQHPGEQCRLDTLFQGALCDHDPLIDFDSSDETIGACSRINRSTIGNRPRCWFLPKNNQF